MAMGLSGLSQLNHPLHGLSSDLLRLNASATATVSSSTTPQFDHSSFRPPLPAYFAFYTSSNQDFTNNDNNDSSQSHHSFTHHNAAAADLFNLSIFSPNGSSSSNQNSNNNNNNNNNNAHLLIPDQFNNSPPTTLLAWNLMNDQHQVGSAGMSSTLNFNSSIQNTESSLPQMSATALLQKASQMGATTSRGSTSSFRSSFSGSDQNKTHLQDLMNSLANGNSSIFGGSTLSSGQGEENNGFGHGFNINAGAGICNMGEATAAAAAAKFQHSLPSNGRSLSGVSDGLTRDFLGVGNVVRGLGSGGHSLSARREQQQQHGIEMEIGSIFDNSELKSAPSMARSFAGGSLQ